jgi:hypothetical protein
MADISEYSIVTYKRKPGHWRAAITRKARTVVNGAQVHSSVTPDDYASESDAQLRPKSSSENFSCGPPQARLYTLAD